MSWGAALGRFIWRSIYGEQGRRRKSSSLIPFLSYLTFFSRWIGAGEETAKRSMAGHILIRASETSAGRHHTETVTQNALLAGCHPVSRKCPLPRGELQHPVGNRTRMMRFVKLRSSVSFGERLEAVMLIWRPILRKKKRQPPSNKCYPLLASKIKSLVR